MAQTSVQSSAQFDLIPEKLGGDQSRLSNNTVRVFAKKLTDR